MNYIFTASGELYHHGVKGMKWGVRRYQNKDGSLTDAGKKRYSRNTDDAVLKDKDSIGRAANASIRRAWVDDIPTWKDRFGEIGRHSSKFLDESNKEYRELSLRRSKELDDLFGDDEVGRLLMLSDYPIERYDYHLSKAQKQEIKDKYQAKLDAIDAKTQMELTILDGKYTTKQYLSAQLKDIGVKDIERGLKVLEELNIQDLDDLAQQYWD